MRAEEALRLSLEQRAAIIESVDGIVWEANPETVQFTFVSPQAERVLGYPVSQWTGEPTFWADHLHPDDRDRAVESCLRACREKRNHQLDYRMVAADGRPVWLRDIVTVVVEGGRLTKLRGIMVDITDRRRADEALREAEERFRIAFQKAPFATALARIPDGTITEVNEEFERVLGYPRQDVEGQTSLERGLYTAEMHERLVAGYRAHGGLRNQEVVVRTKAGAERLMLVNSNPVEIGGQSHVLSAMKDITDRRRAEQRLAASEHRLRAIFDNEPECVKLIGAGGELLDMNPAGLRFIEANSLDEVLGRSMIDLIRAEHRGAFVKLSERVFQGQSGSLEFEIQGLRGTRRWLETHAVPLSDESGDTKLLGITRDITERKRATEHLRRTSDLLAAVAEGTTDALFVKDLDGRYLLCNPAAAHIVGRSPEDVIGLTDAELFDAASARLIAERDRHVRESGETETQEEVLTAAGETRTYLATKSPYRDAAGTLLGVMGISRDITDRKRLERQFLQSQKMEAVGQLAGGVAHDFNNLLTIISGYSEILLSTLPSDDPTRASVRAIGEAGERAAGLTRQLLAFSRQSVLEPKVLDLNAVVRETGNMLRRIIGENILLTTVLDPNLGRVKVDPGQMEQVLMNLAVNARDAMPRGGTITIETGNVERDDNDGDDSRPGRHVLLTVSDTGCGMTPDVKARIFEPFFTTKGVGKGTGLGLAMVFGVVKQSGGRIDVVSEPNFGTSFRISLPAVAEPVSSPETHDGDLVVGGTETILLVEDDDGVRELALLVLQSRGYNVLVAGDGTDAIRVIETHRRPIDLLVTDVVMPGMDGRDLADALRPRFPRMKILFSSGYTDDTIVRHGVLHEAIAFLQKPYSPFSLAKKVRDVLDK